MLKWYYQVVTQLDKCNVLSVILTLFLSLYRVIKDLFPSFVRVPASGSVTPFLSIDKSNYVTCRLRMRSKGVFDWWELTQKSPDPLFGAKENVLEMITFNDLVPPLHFSFFTSTGYQKHD